MKDITPKSYTAPSSAETPYGVDFSGEDALSVPMGTMVQPSKSTSVGGLNVGATEVSQGSGNDIFKISPLGIWLGAANFADAPFSVDMQGNVIAQQVDFTGGTIGGFTITSTSLYGGIIKTAETVGAGTTGVIMDTAGLRGYDSVLGNTFNLPTDGSAPTFSSGVINSTIFEINTNAVLRTSSTVGDGTANSAGILINDTGIYGVAANKLTADANIRILTDGSGFFSGTFNIGGTIITIDNTEDIQENLDTINTAGGGTLYLSSDTFTLTSAGLTMYDGVALVGTSPSGTILDFNNTAGKITIAGTFRYNTGTITSITSGVIEVI